MFYPNKISDLLKIEHFFSPGTIIAVDGRRSHSYFYKGK